MKKQNEEFMNEKALWMFDKYGFKAGLQYAKDISYSSFYWRKNGGGWDITFKDCSGIRFSKENRKAELI